MRAIRLFALASIVFSFLSLAMLAPVVGATTSSTQYAAYSISGNFGNHSITAIVNETVAPSSSSGMSDLTLKIASTMSNFSDSKIVNSSRVIFPYFPTVANQSFSYQVKNYSISATIAQTGTGSVNYGGKTYSLTNYTFSVSGAKAEGISDERDRRCISLPIRPRLFGMGCGKRVRDLSTSSSSEPTCRLTPHPAHRRPLR